jgi:hypothetical protein
MSMLSDQCDRLRELARRMDGLAPGNAALLREAADTIWELRNKLNDADDENERLRKQVARHKEIDAALARADEDLSVIEGRYGIHLTNAELYMLCDAVYAINAKLRERCADLYAEMITYSDAPNYNASVWAPKLRELGVEV